MNINNKIAITGAAGNLGGILARNMLNDDVVLNLLIHNKAIKEDLSKHSNIHIFRVDLNNKDTLKESMTGVDTIVHFAGVLFKGCPEKFLPTTNITYFKNLLDSATESKVRRIVLISFPHVEGETFPHQPANGSLDGIPNSSHAATRLEEEKLLLAQNHVEGVILRCGMVYGKGILMIDTARLFSKYALLGIWKKPTFIHLISTEDFVRATKASIYKKEAIGIYHIGDDGVQTLQDFLNETTKYWKTKRPWKMPLWMINTAALIFEYISLITGCRSPLTRDFIKIGQVSYYGNTARMKQDLLPTLKFKTFQEGLHTL